jgi:hypothetical protein
MNCSATAKRRAYGIAGALLTLIACIIQFCRGVKDFWQVFILILFISGFFLYICDIFKDIPLPQESDNITRLRSFTQNLKVINDVAEHINEYGEEARSVLNEFKDKYKKLKKKFK